MNGPLALALGVVMILVGLLWTGQGLGLIGGSFMSGALVWAVIGPLTALLGLVLIVRARRSTGQG